ncbi:MAG: hypothetical protein GY913_33760 [Proteobacteria bacterium]|nr:hypothetical protein [Pseudomonadota bacterium]MCP4921895.1 hypothetical protein [Pseudomonadota bacterium]
MTPGEHANPAAAAAEARVTGPGTALLITGVLGCLMAVVTMLNALFGFADGIGAAWTPAEENAVAADTTLLAFMGAMNFVFSGVVAAAGWKMRHLESHTLALVGAVLAALPCLSGCGCFLVSVPVGIWCLTVLRDDKVKAAFH